MNRFFRGDKDRWRRNSGELSYVACKLGRRPWRLSSLARCANSKTRWVSGLARLAGSKMRVISGFARRASSKMRVISGFARRASSKMRVISGLACRASSKMRILQGKGEAISHKPLLPLDLDRLYGQTTRAARTIFVARKATGGTLGLLIADPHASSGYL